MRRILVLLIVALVAAPAAAAHAAPRPLMALGDDERFALAGDQVLFTRTRGRTIEVRSMPIAGGPARTVFSLTDPSGLEPFGQLTASAQRAVLFVIYYTPDGESSSSQIFAGTPQGGWSAVTPRRGSEYPSPSFAYIQGDRVLSIERRSDGNDDSAFELVTYAPDRQALPVPAASQLHGDIVASPFRVSGQGAPRDGLSVSNWRTGQQLSTVQFVDVIGGFAVRADGRVVAEVDQTLYDVVPGGVPRVLARSAARPVFGGDRVLFSRSDGIHVLDPGGRQRSFGIPTASLGAYFADAANVLWQANDCVLTAAITDAPAAEPGAGPCARAEFAVTTRRLARGRTVPLRVRCVAAPATGCRGTLRLGDGDSSLSESQRLSIARGQTRTIRVRLTSTGEERFAQGAQPEVTVTHADGRRQSLGYLDPVR